MGAFDAQLASLPSPTKTLGEASGLDDLNSLQSVQKPFDSQTAFEAAHTYSALQSVPSFLLAAGNHSIAGDDDLSMHDEKPLIHGLWGAAAGAWAGVEAGAAFGPWGMFGGAIVGGLTGNDWRFTAAAVVSGVSSFANSAVAIASILPGTPEYEPVMDTNEILKSFDDDLSRYYQQHKEGIDTAGFIAASIAPGLGGLKMYNKAAGMLDSWSAGIIGRNMGRATGLLSGSQKFYMAEAVKSMETSGQAFTFLNKSVVKAIAAGAGEQAIQGVIMETAIQVALNKSPVLENQDYGDIASNVLRAGLYGGILGGAFESYLTSYGVKKAIGITDLKNLPNKFQQGVSAGTPLDEQYLANFESRTLLPKAPTPGIEKLSAKTQVDALNKFDDDNRLILREGILRGKDDVVGNMLHEQITLEQDVLGASKIPFGLVDASRIGTASPIEKQLMQLQKLKDTGKTLSKEESFLLDNTSVKWVNLWGPDAGNVMTAPKSYVSIWDTVKSGEEIKVLTNSVKAGSKEYPMNIMVPYDMSKETDIVYANARELWAIKSKPLPDGVVIHESDVSLLRKARRDLLNSSESGVSRVSIQYAKGKLADISDPKELSKLIKENIGSLYKHHVRKSILAASKKDSKWKLSEEGIASMLNAKLPYLKGTSVDTFNPEADINAIQSYAEEHVARLSKTKSAFSPEDVLFQPQTVKLIHDTSKIKAWEATNLPLQVYLKSQQKLYQETAARAAAPVLGKYNDQFPDHSELNMHRVTRNPVGGSTFLAADSGLGTEGSYFERIGHVVNKAKVELQNNIADQWKPVSYQILGDTKATMELAIIENKMQNFPDIYELDEVGKRVIHADYARYLKELEAGVANARPPRKIASDAPDWIDIESKKVLDILRLNRDLNAPRIQKFNGLRSVSATGDSRNPNRVYFPPPDPKDYKHFALVTDPSITGTGHVKMIHAANEEKLEQLIALVEEEFPGGVLRPPKVRTKTVLERWHKAIGRYDSQEIMSDSYFDAALAKKGVASNYILRTDGKQIVDDLESWHIKEETKLLREAVSVKYAAEFQELKNLGEEKAAIALSEFSSRTAGKYAKESANNPYMSYIRTALDIPNSEQIPLRATQDFLDVQVSKVWDTFTEAFRNSTSVKDLDLINKMITDAGITTINYDAINIALANHTIPRGALSTYTRRANAILTSLILKPSALNAINNTVGALVRLAPETHAVIDAIKAGNSEAVGVLTQVAHVKIPGTESSYLSTGKLMGRAAKAFFKPENRKWLLDMGFSVRRSQEISDIVDTMALTGKESFLNLEGKIQLAYDKGMKLGNALEKATGNSLAEEFTRGTSALIMKELTDVAVQAKVMSPQIAHSYIQTFVNRVNGNYLASQRPMMFNGPIGQAVGLFQTYTLGFIQQSLRHVAEGSLKSTALMLAAQGTIYGMAALPGFQQLNTQLVGSLAGNSDHKDIFSIAYNAMDKEMADWVMYGALSNTLGLFHPDLKINMYTRGDVNPRNISIVPLNPADYPISVASAKFFSNLIETFNKIYIQGATPTAALLQGLEHNGVSRELTGIAQVLEGLTNPQHRSYATDNAGSLVGANDLISLMNLARLAGARPLDEAKASDRSFRQVVYRAKENDRKESLGEVIKTRVVGMQKLTPEELLGFQREYVKIGGKQEGFNQFFKNIYKDANISQSNRLSEVLGSVDSQQMQELMGGMKTNDFSKVNLIPEGEE